MDAQTRIKLTIGDLLMQVAVLSARIEELEEKLNANNRDNPVGLSDSERDKELYGLGRRSTNGP